MSLTHAEPIYRVELIFSRGKPDGTTHTLVKLQCIIVKILKAFAKNFNGARAYSCPGSYRTKDGKIVLEPSTTVMSYTKNLDNLPHSLELLARQVATALDQECVLLTVTELNGEIQWISPDPLFDYIESH